MLKAVRVVTMLVIDRMGNIKKASIDAKDIIQFAELLKRGGYHIIEDSIEATNDIVPAYSQLIRLPKAA